MSAPPKASGEPIEHRRQLVSHLEGGSKPPTAWRIGTEHEKFVFDNNTLRRVPYEGPNGIRKLMEGLTRFGWKPVLENGDPIALTKNGCNITLEPGGQFELSGAPVKILHQTCDEVNTHLDEVKQVAAEMGIGLIGIGFDPKWRREDIPWMPKGRYRIMRDYMPKKGTLGLDMMLRTCTVQVNLDYRSESDMVKKFRVGMALQPIATALFANSPFVEGKPTGYLSYRSHVWEDTDPDRTGILPFVFDGDMGFERYVDYMLDVPMYFVYRNGKYIDASGQSFRDFMDGKLPALPGEKPIITDWVDHLTTAFPEVRLKTYLEMRGADGGPWCNICALPALWVGLLYESNALEEAWELARSWSLEDHMYLRREVPKTALRTPFRGGTVQDVARAVVRIASTGLRKRNKLSRAGDDETGFLAVLQDIADRGETQAEEKLAKFHTSWNGSVDPVFREYAY
jgi:glutamate--cysteine ligase